MMEFLNDSPLKEPLIFDTHAHYDDSAFEEELNQLLTELPHHGVGGIITCGCDIASSKKAISIAEKYDYIYAAVGIHPGNVEDFDRLDEIEELSKHPKCVAIGEIGLDYYWTQDNKPLQTELFEKQLIMANHLSLPVIVHDRDAHLDTLTLLKKHKPMGVVHSFSGSVEMANELTNLGLYIGIGGVVTFKNAKKLPDVVKAVPLDRILLETDAPYLSPVPYRGKINNSSMIYLSAKKIAELREDDTDAILKSTFNNACKLFKIK